MMGNLVGVIGIPEVHLEVNGDDGDVMTIMGVSWQSPLGDFMEIMKYGQMVVRWSEETKGAWFL